MMFPGWVYTVVTVGLIVVWDLLRTEYTIVRILKALEGKK